ncbi:MAG: hypothetical protein JSS56_16300, partial [Proteobacteria bacterium]|nr:hypothetical protein [Pseudomonadota bacterium]
MAMHRSSSVPYPACFDAYLRYALQTGFAYFSGTNAASPTVALLARLSQDVSLDDALAQLESNGEVEFGPMDFRDTRMPFQPRFLTLRVPLALLDASLWSLWDLLFCWVTLSMPVGSRPGLIGTRSIDPDRPKSQSDTLLAVIDDGCPFAHQRLRVAGTIKSRVFAIWDQDTPKSPSTLPVKFGKMPPDFKYGIEFRRATSVDSTGQVLGIDDWIAAHATPAGNVDEEGCYAQAGFNSLWAGRSHGAHVLDLFAGSMPPSSGFSYDPGHPPSFKPAADVASQSDVV